MEIKKAFQKENSLSKVHRKRMDPILNEFTITREILWYKKSLFWNIRAKTSYIWTVMNRWSLKGYFSILKKSIPHKVFIDLIITQKKHNRIIHYQETYKNLSLLLFLLFFYFFKKTYFLFIHFYGKRINWLN